MHPGADMWFNTLKYSPLHLAIFLVGCFLWVIAYIAVIRHAIQQKFLVLPAGAVVANFAWEWLWGFVFKPDMGLVVWWGYRTWAILDIAILFFLFKYGREQLITTQGRKYFAPMVAFGLVSWFSALYFFIRDGLDISIGANSAYIINAMMSAMYIVMVAKHPDIRRFSFRIAWTKCVGTGLTSLFMFITPTLTMYGTDEVPAKRGFLLTLCILTLILDVIFMATFRVRLNAAKQNALA